MAQGLHINMHYWLLYGLPVWIVLRSIILFIKKLLKKQFKLKQEFIFNIFVLYIFVLIGITLFPIDIYWVKQIYYSKPSIQFIPILDIIKVARRIDSISSFKIFSANLLGNILITVPIGIFPPILWKRKFTKLKSVTLLALLISLAIEVLQYLEGIIFPSLIPRICDINDIIINVIGTILGYFIYSNLFNNKYKLSDESNLKNKFQ